MPPFASLYINGKFVPASDGGTFEVRNPFSGEVVSESASASSADCKAAVDAAAEALKTWETSAMTTRRQIFLRAAELVKTDKYRKKILDSIQEETAAAPYWAMYNWVTAGSALITQAGLVDHLRGDTYPSSTVPGGEVLTERRPMGVMRVVSFPKCLQTPYNLLSDSRSLHGTHLLPFPSVPLLSPLSVGTLLF
ncbi:hypothetical protein D9613_008507 [Agrocybe pediades]|uniref:Aldehyde dehydrogenase domain-containing protein n=1 Tax=Agrocybe pediades TaxID=84607 RepID=A0A8H4QVB1_9AGAR|nr:hypothetical protein D9613_008507 [Agrocybe pediades]